MMSPLFKTSFAISILLFLHIFTACEKEDNYPDNKLPTLTVSDTIVGKTDVNSLIEIQASDPDDDKLNIRWEIIESPASSAPVIEVKGTEATFTSNIAGRYIIEFIADDGKGKTSSDITNLYIGGVLQRLIGEDVSYPDLFENEDYPDYYALNSVEVTAGLTLEPGVVLELGSDVHLLVSGDLSYLNAEGSPEKNIILRGMDKVKGSWKAVEIASNNVNNKLNYVQIMHAGSSEVSNHKTALILDGQAPAKFSIKNTHISQSAGYGLYVNGYGGKITAFETNNFSDNDAAPIRFGAENMYALDKNSIYTNNGIQAIEIASGSDANAVFSTTGTVIYPGLPYHIYSSLELNAQVSFELKVECHFDIGTRLWVTSKGSIIATSIANWIIFRGLNKVQGAWHGIEISSASPLNMLDGCAITHGGNNAGRGANVYTYPGAQLVITNCVVSDSQSYGIKIAPWASFLTIDHIIYSNNFRGDIKWE